MRIDVAVACCSFALASLLASCISRAPLATHADPPCPRDSTASRPPLLRRAAIADLRGQSGATPLGELAVRVDSSASQRRVERATAFFEGTRIWASTDAKGWATLTAPAGAYTLRVRRIGYADQRVPIELRAGYRDTVSLGLGAVKVCLVEQVEVRE